MSTSNDHDAFDQDDDLRALLRSGDPSGSLRPADPAALAHLLEDIMSADLDVRPDPDHDVRDGAPRRRTRVTWLVAAAAATAIVGGGGLAISGLAGDGATPPTAGRDTTTASSGPSAGDDTELAPADGLAPPVAGETTELSVGAEPARCAVATPEILAQYTEAFQGQVTAIDESAGTVTMTATGVYAGEVGETVQVAAAPQLIGAMVGSVGFEVGGTYNVAVFDGQVSTCGYSGPAAGQTEQLFQEAFLR